MLAERCNALERERTDWQVKCAEAQDAASEAQARVKELESMLAKVNHGHRE